MTEQTSKTAPSGDTIKDLQESLQAMKKTPATVAGKRVYVVTPEHVETLQGRVDKALANSGATGASPNALIALHDELESLRADNKIVHDRLEHSLAAEKSATDSLKTVRSLHDMAKKALETAANSNKEIQLDWRRQLSKAQADLVEARKALKTPEAKFDPEAAMVLKEAEKAAASEISILNSKLADLNEANNVRQAEVNLLHKKIKAAEEAVEVHKKTVASLKNALYAGDVSNETFELSPAIRTMLGDDACKILLQWHNLAFDDVKEKAFVGMKALGRHRNKFLKGIGKLFEIVFLWCKEHTMKARKALLPWVNMIIADLASAKLKSIAFYRDELVKLQVIIREKKEAIKTKREQEGRPAIDTEDTWFSDLWFYGYAIMLRIRRRTSPWYKKGWSYVKGSAFVVAAGVRNVCSVVATAVRSAVNGDSYAVSQMKQDVLQEKLQKRRKAAWASAFPKEDIVPAPFSDKEGDVTPIWVAPEASSI